MSFDFTKAAAHADQFWFRPCEDGGVVSYSTYITIPNEIRARHLVAADWEAGFFKYGGGKEGLFLISKSFAPSVAQRITARFSIDSVPDPRHFLCSWPDKTKETAIGQTPPYTGLNDCTHFVTECLDKAGVAKIKTSDPQIMFDRLRGMGAQTKSLAVMVDVEKARRIINRANILKVGDVLIYATPKRSHLHCGLYLGKGQVAQHTHINHSSSPEDQIADKVNGIKNNWEASANTVHPLVTIIHFTRSDDVFGGTFMAGWWKVTRGAQTRWYFFEKSSGSVGAVSKQPQDLSRPPAHPEEKGYWFEDSFVLSIVWPGTGDVETYSPIYTPEKVIGAMNGSVPLKAVKAE